MRIPRAALLVAIAAPVAAAFATPSAPATATHSAFGIAQRGRRRRDQATFLRSTTVKNEVHQDTSEPSSSASNDITEIISTPALTPEQAMLRATRKARTSAKDFMSQYENQSGAAIVYSKLQENGVDVVNGYSGGAVLPLLDQFHVDNPRHKLPGAKTPIRWITNSNEASAGHIAEGYAKSMPINGEFMPCGVAVATSGPGVTNLITPLQDAICDGVPMVILCGQAATTAPPDAFQSAPAVAMTEPCTKWSYQIKSAAEIPFVMDYAFFVARNGRPGPVFVDLPKDLQNQILSPDMIENYVENALPEEPSDTVGMASLEQIIDADGNVAKAFRLGNEKFGLSFDIVKTDDGKHTLKPVSSTIDTYNQDHHPTDRIIYTASALTGEPRELVKEGPLDLERSITKEMMELIRKAKKPIILAGQGCNDSAAELKEFAEKLQIPVTTTLHALGCFDERHPLALNMLGMHGHPTPNYMIQDADLIINIGSRFDDRITGRMGDFVPGARKAAKLGIGGVIHVDIRLSEHSKQLEPTFFVHSTAKTFLNTLNTALDKEIENGDLKIQTGEWLKHKKELEAEFPIKIPSYKTESMTMKDEDGNEKTVSRTRMSAQSVVREMDTQLLKAGKMDDCIFTTGVGIHQMVTAQLITWTQPRQMLSSGSLGTMGVALGYVVGAKLANGKKMCIAVDGDGSFNMTFTELKTVAEQKIPIKIMILDNESQMMVEYWQRLFHDARFLAVRNDKNPDYVKLASAFGIKAVYCDREEDLPDRMNDFLFNDPEEPVLFHVRIERTPCLPLVAPGQPLDDMILEDVEVEVDQSAAPS